jgi:hypothetical protein
MLEWLFEPIFKTETCVGVDPSNVTCHVEAFGLSPIILITVATFLGYLTLAALINKRKEQKMEKLK